MTKALIEKLRGGLIVSCQASESDPTFGAEMMVAFARAAHLGGAKAIRANGVSDVRAIKQTVPLPLIGIQKEKGADGATLITGSAQAALEIVTAGADIVALDATQRPRPGGLTAADLIAQIRRRTDAPIMADVETLEQGIAAAAAGAHIVATTLSVFHCPPYTPDLQLIASLVANVRVPVIAEGNFWTPEDVRKAFVLGAHAVVVGSAITRPWLITERFAAAIPSALRQK